MFAIEGIVKLSLEEVRKRLQARFISLDVSERAIHQMAIDSYIPAFGARPVKRFIQATIESKLGRALISGEFNEGDVVHIDYIDGDYVIEHGNWIIKKRCLDNYF